MGLPTARDIIFDYFSDKSDQDFESLMGYLPTDTLVAWFVDEGYIDSLDGEEEECVMNHYSLHC